MESQGGGGGGGGRFNVRKLSETMMQGVPEHGPLELTTSRSMSSLAGGGGSVADLYNSSSTTAIYDPSRKVSLVHLTLEALPREDNYRINCQDAVRRPSLGEVHGDLNGGKDLGADETRKEEEHGGHGVKLGWIQGVLIPCTLNIWGVMLFLRLSWVVGQSGIAESLVIIAVSAIVCVVTTLSLSAISTNGEVKGGGIYYMISRSLGPEFGAAIGIVFAFANAVAASMNTIGFCSSLNDLLKSEGYKIVDGGNNDIRIVGVVTILVLIVVCVVGMEWEVKAQNVLIVIISGAVIDFLVGTAIGPINNEEISQGFVGFNATVLAQNWGSNYRYSEGQDQNIFTVFAIFFPSVTGIQAGANISGDLKDPASAIPKGTLLSLLITMISYAIFVVFAGGAAIRDATGNVMQVANSTFADCLGRECQYGLMNSYSIMQLMSVWGPFIYAGCFAATLSTALTNLLSVPKLLEALGKDRIYPGFIFFSKGYFKSHEPLRGYALTFLVSAAFLLIAELNAVAPLISNFYLASYAMINFCTFHAALVKPLGWRPTFRFYNMWLSLFGFFLCVAIMFTISWITSLITFIIIITLYLVVVYRKPDVNWGSSTQAQNYKTALQSAHQLNNIQEHVKNYRPQILVLAGKPQHRPPLMDLANLITKNNSLLVCGEISQKPLSNRKRNSRVRGTYKWFEENKIKSFYSLIDGIGFEEGAKALIQSSGIGKLKPNVLMMGYKSDWVTCHSYDLTAYFHVMHEAFDNRLAVTILRLPDGLDYSKWTDDDEDHVMTSSNNFLSVDSPSLMRADSTLSLAPRSHFLTADGGGLMHADSNLNLAALARTDSDTSLHLRGVSAHQYCPDSPVSVRSFRMNNKNPKDLLKSKKRAVAENILNKQAKIIPEDITYSMSLFQRKPNADTIDVWWLYDDGGLTILLPYIISTRHNYANCKLRIFALANRRRELELEKCNMAKLLSKFRIDYASLTMVDGITETPQESTQQYFSKLLDGFRETDGADKDCMVTDSELEALKGKTDRQLRLREMLQENSKDAALVVMSLPMPRKGSVPAPMYMAWLEVITSDMPPFLMVRGNHSSVLSFYA